MASKNTTADSKPTAREELRKARRLSRVSKAAVTVADNTLENLMNNLDPKTSDLNSLKKKRTILEKENQTLQTQLQTATITSLGTSVSVGIPQEPRITPINSPREHMESKLSRNTSNSNNSISSISSSSTANTNTNTTTTISKARPSSKGTKLQLTANVSFSSKEQLESSKQNPPGFSPWSTNSTKQVKVKQTKPPLKTKKKTKKKKNKPSNTTTTKNIPLLPPSSTNTTSSNLPRKTNLDPWAQFSKPKPTKTTVLAKWRAQTERKARPLGADGPELIIRLICAEDVLALDRLTGKSDPVAFLFCGKESKLSEIKIGTVDPYWNAEFRFGGAIQDIRHIDELHIQVKDDDGINKEAGRVRGRTASSTGSKVPKMKRLYENLGGVTVNLKEIRESKTKWSKPKWYVLEPMKGMSIVRGRLRLSIRYVGVTDKNMHGNDDNDNDDNDDDIDNTNNDNNDEEQEDEDLMDQRMRNNENRQGDQSMPEQDTNNSSNSSTDRRRRSKQSIKSNDSSYVSSSSKEEEDSSNVPKYLERKVEQLSTFRSKTRAELKTMAQKLEAQSSLLENARTIAQDAQRQSNEHKKDCDDKGAKLQELAHTIETLQRNITSPTRSITSTNSNQGNKNRNRKNVRFEQLVSRDRNGVPTTTTGLQFEDQHEFILSVTNALHRLRLASTRPSGHTELRQIADALTSSKARALWRCFRSGENDGDINFQRESAIALSTFAEGNPRACASTLTLAMECIARRIVSGGNDAAKNNALIQSVGVFALHVLPVALAGKVQPSLIPAVAPFCDLIQRYPHAIAGEVAARCISEIIGPTSSKRATEKFQILGLSKRHCDGDDTQLNVLRRMLLSSLPNLPHPASMTTNKTELTLSIDVTSDEAPRFYSILLKGRHLLPDGWIVAASDVRPAPDRKKGQNKNNTNNKNVKEHAPPPPAVTERGESKRHLMLIGSCAIELFHTTSKLITLFKDCEDKTLVAMFDVFCTTCNVARRGLTIQDTRVTRAMCACGAIVLQSALDVLMQRNKSFIWRQRRAALQTIGALATLDRDIAMYNLRRGSNTMRKDVPCIYDVRVDMVVIQDAVYRARQDKVNVVRNAASFALDSLDGMSRARNGTGIIDGIEDEDRKDTRRRDREVREVTEVEDNGHSRSGRNSRNGRNGRSGRNDSNSYGSTSERPRNTTSLPLPPSFESKYEDEERNNKSYTSRSTKSTKSTKSMRSMKSSTLLSTTRSKNQSATTKYSEEYEKEYDDDNNSNNNDNDDQESVMEEPTTLASLLTPLSPEDTEELEQAIQSCMSSSTGGATQMSMVMSGWLDENAEDMVSSFMVETMDDGTNLSRAFTLLPRRYAKRVLTILGSTMFDLVSTMNQQPTFSLILDDAMCRMLRWIYAALNSNHWSADDIIHGNVAWTSVRDSVQMLSKQGSSFSRKMHAAKIYALLRSVVLLESHLRIFASDRRNNDSSDDDSSCESDDEY